MGKRCACHDRLQHTFGQKRFSRAALNDLVQIIKSILKPKMFVMFVVSSVPTLKI